MQGEGKFSFSPVCLLKVKNMLQIPEVLVIGAGIAGATAALNLADAGFEVVLVSSASGNEDGNSQLAQGGIVFQADSDLPEALPRDIMQAGDYVNYRKAVKFLCKEGPKTVQEILIDRLHIPFTRGHASNSQVWDLTLEGGHSAQRILHCADYTGRAIM